MGTKLGARHAWAMVWLVSGMAAIGQEALAAKPARGSGPGPARDVQWTELGDVVVDSGAAWAEGQYRATSLTVANGATLTVAGGATIEVAGVLSIGGNSTVRFEGKNTDAQVDGVWAGSGVTLAAGDVVIEAGSRLAADGSGYGPSSGPGYGGTAGGNGGGGSYGGWGGQMGDPGGAPYGSIEEPVDLGSGGGWGDGDGTPGGGAIRLSVTGALKVDGVISADGARVDGYRHGAGSGGSVWITVTGSLTGSGRISANGGATDWGSGTGGGGRVAIYAGSSLDTFGGTISAASGQLAREGTVGGAGTVYLKVADWPHGDLILDNAGRDAARLTPLLLNHTVRDLRLAHAAKAELTVAGDALAQTGTGELRVEAGTSLFVHNALTLGRVHVLAGGLLGGVAGSPNLTLTTAGDMVVDVDGKITVDGLGYGSGSGPGYGGSAGANGGGGSYGGWGGQMGDAGGAPYGSIEEPVAPGSGGGWGDGDGTPGGGVLRLVVGGALRVDGVVSADGARVGGPRPGAGSGGSVWITVTGSLTGTGRVSANGGAADWGSGTGGGGRVAIYFGSSLDTFAGTISAAGGQLAREGTGGGAGTVYLKAADWPHGDLVLDNAGQDAERLTPLVLSQTVRDLRLAHRAEAELTATGDAAILTGAGELSVSPGCRLLVHGGVVFGRAHVFGGATVTHLAGERGFLLKTNGDFVLDSGGLITADALGYGAGTGPGYGGTSGGYHGGGGSYGGWGGQMGDRGGVLYGSAEEPEDFGSGGGWGEGPGGAGGGAIRLIVARALQMDGTITANGETTGCRRASGRCC